MATLIQLRRSTAAQWTAANPLLADGEPALEKDTGKEKVGDGVRRWVDLPYKTTGGGGFDPALIAAKGDLVVGTAAGQVARQSVSTTDGQLLTSDGASATGVRWASPAGATLQLIGGVRLAGDLAGTALSPTVPGLVGKYTFPIGGMPRADMAAEVRASLAAADGALQATRVGVPGGVATLGTDGKVSPAQLPLSAGAFPLGSANNPVRDPQAQRPDLGPGVIVYFDTTVEPLNWADNDIQLESS